MSEQYLVITAVGEHGPSRDPNRLALAEDGLCGVAGARFAADPQAYRRALGGARRVRGSHREAVHRRVVKARDGFGAGHVLRQHRSTRRCRAPVGNPWARSTRTR